MQDDADDADDGDDDADADDVRCSTAALDLAVPADGALRPLERLDGRWTCMSMPQHVNLIAYGGQFTDATWPSFGRRRRLLRSAAVAAAAAAAAASTAAVTTPADERPQTARGDVRPAAEGKEDVDAVVRTVEQAVSSGDGGRQGFWRRFLSCFRGLFRLLSPAKRRVRRATPRFKCTTL